MSRFLYFVLSLYLVSCSEEIDFTPYAQHKVVVNCILTTEPVQKLTLTYSNVLDNSYFEKITRATVSLFASNELVGYFQMDDYNDWVLNYTPITGQLYKLNVEIPGEPLIEASTTMPVNVPVTKDNEENETFVRKFFIQDEYVHPYWIFVMDKKDSKDGITSKDKLKNSIGTTHKDCDRFNLSGESMSIVIGADARTQEQLVYLRIVPAVDKVYHLCVEAQVNDSWFFFRAVSGEYDRYLKTSFQKMLIYQSFDDPSQWFDENTIYTNIKNGLGIFGASSDVIFKYK